MDKDEILNYINKLRQDNDTEFDNSLITDEYYIGFVWALACVTRYIQEQISDD